MSYFYKKKKKASKKLYSWLALLVLFCIFVFLIRSVFSVYQGERKSRINKNQSELIFNKLKENEDLILSEIEYLKAEKGVETELRDKFRVVKEGEEMAVIINSKNENNFKAKTKKKENIWSKLVNFLRD